MEKLIDVGGRTKLLAKDVTYFEAAINYTIIHYAIGATKVVATTIGHIQERISNGFVRPNRSYLVNLEYINSCQLGEILLQNDLKINIARRKTEKISTIVADYFEQKNAQTVPIK